MQYPLATLATVHGGYHSRTAIATVRSGTHRLVRLRDLLAGDRVEWSRVASFDAAPPAASTLLEAGDVLFRAKGGPVMAVAVDDVPFPAFVDATFFAIRPDRRRLVPGYLAWYLSQEPVRRQVERQAGSGVLTLSIPRCVVESLPIPVQPLAVQRRIAELVALLRDETELAEERMRHRHELVNRTCLDAVLGRPQEE